MSKCFYAVVEGLWLLNDSVRNISLRARVGVARRRKLGEKTAM